MMEYLRIKILASLCKITPLPHSMLAKKKVRFFCVVFIMKNLRIQNSGPSLWLHHGEKKEHLFSRPFFVLVFIYEE